MVIKTAQPIQNSVELTFRILLSELRGAITGTKKPITLFLGAGCSLSSLTEDGVSVASTTEIIRSVVEEWLCASVPAETPSTELWSTFRELWIKQGVEQRRRDIARRLEGLKPSSGYHCISRLAERGCIGAIITTNFDLMLDVVLNHIPHIKRIGNKVIHHIEARTPVLELVKVHGDIHHGGILFEPRELHRLPDALTKRVSELTRGSTLVVGYSGQDHGIMSALCHEPDFNAFWSNPQVPTYDEEYYFSPIIDWMQSRNSRSNYLFGESLGFFESLFSRIDENLSHHTVSALVKNGGTASGDAILSLLQTSRRLMEAYDLLRHTIEKVAKNWGGPLQPPFSAPSTEEALQRLKYAIELPAATRLVEAAAPNELETLVLALAVEISARVGLEAHQVNALVSACREAHDAIGPTAQLDGTFWKLVADICTMNDSALAPTNLRIHFNHGTRLTLLSECKDPGELRAVLRYLHNICFLAKGDIDPRLATSELASQLMSLRSKVKTSRQDGPVTVLEMEALSRDDISLLRSSFVGIRRFEEAVDRLLLEAEHLRIEGTVVLQKKVAAVASTLSEKVLTAARASTRSFLDLSDPYGMAHDMWAPVSTNSVLSDFAEADEPALIIVGGSGTGKTTSLKTFIKERRAPDSVVFVTSPRLNGRAPSLAALFFPFLHGADEAGTIEALHQLDAHLADQRLTLFLVLDGLNEFDAEFEDVRRLYLEILGFAGNLASERLSRIKIIVTVRTHYFMALRRTAASPSPEYFYSRAAHGVDCEDGAVTVAPLNSKEIERIAAVYFKPDVAAAFLELISNVPRLAHDYSHPFLLAVAGKVTEKPEDVEALQQSSRLFQRFAGRMLERLGSPERQNRALATIHEYFQKIMSRDSGAAVVTEFALNQGLGNEAYRLISELQDAKIFHISPVGTISFTHDRIAEHFLGDFLLHHLEKDHAVATAFRHSSNNPIFIGGLRCLTTRLLQAGLNTGDRDLELVHRLLDENVLPDGAPTSEILIDSLVECEPGSRPLVRLIESSPNPGKFREGLGRGLWRCVERLPLDILRSHFEVCFAGGTFSTEAFRAVIRICFALGSLADSTRENALRLAEEHLNGIACDALANVGHVWVDRGSMLRARIARERGEIVSAITALSDLLGRQLRQVAWSHAVITALELGRAYRDNTEFDKALEVYGQFARIKADLPDTSAALLALQTATVRKNLVQELQRRGAPISEMRAHYDAALEQLEEARIRGRKGQPIGTEVEAAVERIETHLAARTFVPEALDLAREAALEAERLISFHPRHRVLIVYLRQVAKIRSLSGDREEAILILRKARALAERIGRDFYVADCDYQLGHMIADDPELRNDEQKKILAITALQSAIGFYEDYCAPDNVYKHNCLQALSGLQGRG